MRRLVLINPNSTVAMTEAMLESVPCPTGSTLTGWTNPSGPPAIQGEQDGQRATPGLLELIDKANDERFDAIIIACFDDTALAEAKRRSPCPVVGIGEAAFHVASLRGWTFAVITTLEISVPIIQENIARYGLDGICAAVDASDVQVLEFEQDPASSHARVAAAAEHLMERTRADALVLGCAGMTSLRNTLTSSLGHPVIDGVESAVKLASALADASN